MDNIQKPDKNKTMTNIGWMFYKDYFNRVDFNYVLNPDKEIEASNAKTIKEKNRKIIEDTSLAKICDGLGNPNQNIELKINYPGLITGIGITHEAVVEGEFKLGLHFDYAYGCPIIHGSSVKGVLRTVFPNFSKGKDKNPESKLELLLELLNMKLSFEDGKSKIKEIENEIFEGINHDKKRINIYQRDIFYDAIILKPDANGRILERDALVPHGTNPLKNPIPLPFLKISSSCTMQFRFDLKDGEILTADQKIKLFKKILSIFGIGAKTNVGYGQFEEE